MLRFLETTYNEDIIWKLNPDFRLEFVGLMAMTPKEFADLMTQRVRSTNTVDEIRAELDLGPLPDGLGGVILDANHLAFRRQREQAALQHQQEMQQQANEAAAAGLDPNQTPGVDEGVPNKDEPSGAGTMKPQLPGQKANPQSVAPPVGSIPSDPTSPEQIKELEALLRPATKG